MGARCVLYGREGYHALFLRPIAQSIGCVYKELDYLTLYRHYKSASPGLYYIEDVWYIHGVAPKPPWPVAQAARRLIGRLYPILGNVQVFYTNGLYNYIHEVACGRAGLLAKEGEPLVTDLFLPLYLEMGSVEKALYAAKEFYKCGLPSTPAELTQGVINDKFDAAYLWLAWAPQLPLRPNPVLKKAVAGFWGLTAVSVEVDLPYVHSHPPPYLDVDWGPYSRNKRLVEESIVLRGPRWMEYVENNYVVLFEYLRGNVSLDKAAERLKTGLEEALYVRESIF